MGILIQNWDPKLIVKPTVHLRLSRSNLRYRIVAGDSAVMASNTVRIAAAQMTSVNDLATNFATCSRLVKVFVFFYMVEVTM